MSVQIEQLPIGAQGWPVQKSRRKIVRLSSEEQEAAKRLIEQGESVRKVAKRFQVSVSAVYSWIRRSRRDVQIAPSPKELKLGNPRNPPRDGASPLGNNTARLCFVSGIFLEIPSNQINQGLLEILSNLR